MNLYGIPCPQCKRKGLHYCSHPHAFGWKDYDHAECRFCHGRFKAVECILQPLAEKVKREEEA
jgi:hypothetical protein